MRSELFRALEDRIEIVHREVERLRSGVRALHLHHLQRGRTAFVVHARAGLLATLDVEKLRVERNRLVQIADFDVESEELRNIFLLHGFLLNVDSQSLTSARRFFSMW